MQCNESKTEKRKIPIPLFTEDLKAFSNSSYYQNLKDDDIIFKISYDYFLRKIKENSIRLFNDKKDEKKPKVVISPHALRHSSATYYAREFDGNMNLLAERFGWTYSSRELRTYIRRSGAYQKAGAKKIFTNEVMKIKEEMAMLKEQYDEILPLMDELMKSKENNKPLIQALIGKTKEERNIREMVKIMRSQNRML